MSDVLVVCELNVSTNYIFVFDMHFRLGILRLEKFIRMGMETALSFSASGKSLVWGPVVWIPKGSPKMKGIVT